MKAMYHGHSVVSIETNGGVKLLIDPFINRNPLTDLKVDEVNPDVILVTHAHGDHLGDTVEIAKRTNALVVSTVEIVNYLASLGVERVHGLQPGGAFAFDFATIKLTQAIHGSSIEIDGLPYTLGLATGIMIKADNQTIYHVGDTALFSDLKLIGELNHIDLAFIPIGDNYTMGPEDALLAAEWLKAKTVVPIHYNTMKEIEQDPHAFINQLKDSKGIVAKLGEPIDF